MAYNPFNVFRRNQKGLFAVLTIFVMIMFVLSFGQGDLFTWLPKLVGSNRGDTMAKVDGDKVTDVDLGDINQNRGLASDFMVGSVDLASSKMDTYIKENIGQASRDQKQLFIQFYAGRNARIPYLNINPEMLQMYMSFPQGMQMLEQQRRSTMFNLRSQLSALVGTAGTSKEDLDLAKTALNLMDLDDRKQQLQFGYFHHKASEDASYQSAFEFDLWLRKAKQLGVNYTAEDARKLYLEEFHNQIDNDALLTMEKQLFANRTNYTRDSVFKVLADEFKVRVAKGVVIGRGNSVQIFPTPWDTFEYFRKECDGASYALFSVPAENYIAKVQGAPNESEMRKLFDTYRNKEADPAKDNLGLREPRRLKIGWIEIKGDEPYYKKAGEDSLALGDVQAKAAFAAMVPFPGTGFGLFAAAAVWNMTDGALTGAYAAYTQSQQQKIDLTWFANLKDPLVLSRVELQDTHVAQADTVAGLIAAAGGAFATNGGPSFAPVVMIERARMKDREARVRALSALLTVPFSGTNLIGNHLAMWGTLPKPIALSAIRHELIEKVKVEATRKAAERDIAAFQTEVAKLGEKPDKAEVNAYIAKFVAERGLKFGESKDLRDQYTLGEDPGLATLVAKQTRGHAGLDVPLQFGRTFFYEADMMTRREVESKKLFEPKPFPESFGPLTLREGEPSFLAWRSAEQPAESPKNFEKTKPKIVELWKRIEARKLAEAAAEEYTKKMRDELAARPGSDQLTSAIGGIFRTLHAEYQTQFTDFNDKFRTMSFTIDNVSPISTPFSPIPTLQPQRPQEFQLRPKKEMPYPTAEMQTQLLENKDKPFGTTLVLHDESKDRYFVAALMDRQFRHFMGPELNAKFMTDAYTGVGDLPQIIRGSLREEERIAAIKSAVLLLKAEFKVTDESDKLKPGEGKKK